MKTTFKYIFLSLGILLFLMIVVPLGIATYLYLRADFLVPEKSVHLEYFPLQKDMDSLRISGKDYFLLNDYGLWESRISGTPLDRGAKIGILSKDLIRYQEEVFYQQIRQIVPSDTYIRFLHKLIMIFNGNMARHIPEEFREEIYGISQSCSHDYDAFGTPYERQLNYHAAHDIGHTMQDYMLVGCTSFAVWGDKSADNGLLVGRNFDFYVGDDFARNKVLLFVAPQKGYRYVSVTWPGMVGVVSGMNECGLTVTINASKGPLPLSSATPISLLVRNILQYASDINSACYIAKSCQTFVSESILVASSKDGRAVVIEKSPDAIGVYSPEGNQVLCTNHFQSETFIEDRYNIKNIKESDSQYRMERLDQLISSAVPLEPEKAAAVLRDYRGLDGKNIGWTHQKSINQSIAHHSVIFQPEQLKLWVSTQPWQAGRYLCFDMEKVFASDTVQSQVLENLSIAEDSLFLADAYESIIFYRKGYRKIVRCIKEKKKLDPEFIYDFMNSNPEYFDTYNILGDYYFSLKDEKSAADYWKKALTKEIPSVPERNKIVQKIKKNN